MKFPISMLKEFVASDLSAESLGDLLTMAGFELEGIEDVEGEPVLDIKVVSNRGDGLSVFGLSREVLAKDSGAQPTDLYRQIASGYLRGDEATSCASIVGRVVIHTDSCTRFGCRMFNGVTNGDAPEWMQKRLRQMGMRPISLLVDVTNYVMVELGQPLHAYDYATLGGGEIQVRQAAPGEKLTTLNGIEHTLDSHHMLIADAERAIGIAGVMGGENTEVSPQTTRVLLEAAHFVNTSVRKTRKNLGLSTEASYRFERSVDPLGVVRALNRVAVLLEDALGRCVTEEGVMDLFPSPPKLESVPVRVSRANLLMGYEGDDAVDSEQVRHYLERLGFEVNGNGEPFLVTSPSWRPDIELEEDLVEEIGRIHGYERIPERGPIGETPIGGTSGLEALRELLAESLMRQGLVQTISHSLRDTHPLQSQSPIFGPRNPGSPEHAFLRNSLWPSLADAANVNGNRNLHLFESGIVHTMQDGEYIEVPMLAMLSTGALMSNHWVKTPPVMADFYSLKSGLESLGRAVRRPFHIRPSQKPDTRLHPTRQAELWVGDDAETSMKVAVFGQIHPDIAEQASLQAETVLAELNLRDLFQSPESAFEPRRISRNPATSRDISILMPKSVAFATIDSESRRAILDTAVDVVLEAFTLADIYTGKGIEPGFHSLTLSFTIRKLGANFTDEEANQVRDRVVAAMQVLGGVQR